MKVALVSPVVANSELLCCTCQFISAFYRALKRIVDTDWLQIPASEATWEDILESYVQCYDLDVSGYDVVISTRTPTFMIRHRRHVCWLVSQMRAFYDRLGNEYGGLDPGALEERKQRRELIHTLDTAAFSNIQKLLAIGARPAERLKHYNGFEAEVLYPPAPNSGYHCRGQEYLLLPAGPHDCNRVDLAVQALRSLPHNIALLIPGDRALLPEIARNDHRVRFLGHVSDAEMVELYANALAVLFLPKDEDFGYVTVEAMLSHKPVITCTDSGESTCLVQDGTTGYVVAPNPAEVAAAIGRLVCDRGAASQMGEAAFCSAPSQSWDTVVARLFAGTPLFEDGTIKDTRDENQRSKIFVADNQVLDPPVGGGRIRIYELYRKLAVENFEVTYVGAYDWPGPEFRDQYLKPHFREIVTPLTQPHFRVNSWIQRLAGGKTVIDVTIPQLLWLSPRFANLAAEHSGDADAIIICHPWVYPYVFRRPGQLLVYDAQNCEADVKEQILGHGLVGRYLLRQVKKVESRLCRDADLIFACSENDIARFVQLYGVPREKLVLVENGVDVDQIIPADERQKQQARRALRLATDKPLLIFIGSGYLPNAEAVSFIVEHLALRFPESTFLIVGSIRDFCQRDGVAQVHSPPSNVHWTGTVSNEQKLEIYRAADIALNPMFSGSGTNLKMLDYFAAGLPVVSTPAGARGLNVTERECLVCEAPLFENTIRLLLTDEGRRTSLGAAARTLAVSRCSWKTIAENACQALQTIVLQKPLGRRNWNTPS